jgi:hypothetical protein
MQKNTDNHEEHAAALGHEVQDVNLKFFASVMVGLFLILLTGMSVSLWYQNTLREGVRERDTPPPPLAATLPQTPPEPRLQQTPGVDLQKFRAEEEKVLQNYGWIDAQSGIAHIPIERAMELTAQRGLPVRGEAAKQGSKK